MERQRFEIPSRYRDLSELQLRYARSGTILCPVRQFDKPPTHCGGTENICWCLEWGHVREGGCVLVHGDPSSGKSVIMRLLAERPASLAELSVGVIYHPQSNLSDFHREIGDMFGICHAGDSHAVAQPAAALAPGQSS